MGKTRYGWRTGSDKITLGDAGLSYMTDMNKNAQATWGDGFSTFDFRPPLDSLGEGSIFFTSLLVRPEWLFICFTSFLLCWSIFPGVAPEGLI